MILEILKDDFMDCREVLKIAVEEYGLTKAQLKVEKKKYGIKTVQVDTGDAICWLWFNPKAIWEKYHA